jgi:nitrite reductase (NO-forming)
LFIHSQANEDSRIHLIGGHGDLVWPGGSFNNTPTVDRETWHVNGGEAVAAIYTFKQPGIYAYVNHNLIEAIMLGGAAHISVEGKWNNDLMKQVKPPSKIK